VDSLIVELTTVIMSSVMFDVDVKKKVSRWGRF